MMTAAVLRLWQLPIYPPGPHYDEGAYLLITRSIAFGGARFFPIVEAYQGREVLYMYLNALLLHLWGDRIFTLHLTSAFVSLIMIAASIRLGRAMFRGERGIVIALIIGVVALGSFPQLILGRQAFRAVTLPMMQAVSLVLLWHGLKRPGRWVWLILAGVFAGGAIYTYNSSRLFPFWLSLAGTALLIIDRGNWQMRLRQGAVFWGALGLVAAPMVAYAVIRPDIFWGRLVEVTLPGQSISYWESMLLHLRMFFIEGDPYLRYNIPHRPYFTWPEGILLMVGAVIALWRMLRPGPVIERAAYALALLSPLMVLPSVVSVGGLPPSHMRSMAMIPLAFVLVGIGGEALFADLQRRLRYILTPPAVVIGIVCLTLIGGIGIGRAYFSWASSPELFYETDADLSLAARWLDEHTLPGERVYLAAKDRSHPTVMIEQTPPITWLGTNTLFRAPAGGTGLYVFPRSAPPPEDWRIWLEQGRIADLPLAPDGRAAFEAFRLSGSAPLPISAELPQPVPRNTYLELRGVYARPAVSGSETEVVTAWEVIRPPTAVDLTPLIQLEDAQGTILSRGDIYMTDTQRWEAGAVLFVRLPVTIPPATPPLRYAVRVAWVERAADRYAAYLREGGGDGSIWATVGSLPVLRPGSPPQPNQVNITQRLELDVADGIRLIGYDPASTQSRPGEVLAPTLFWQAVPTSSVREDNAYRVELLGVSERYMLAEYLILNRDYPPSEWRDGEVLADHVRWRLPRDIQSGSYMLNLIAGDSEVHLGELRVVGLPRNYEAPTMECTVNANFGGRIRLIGYSLNDREGGLNLTLVWQSLATMAVNYTVFVHLLDTEELIVTQVDAMPLRNTYPTTLWDVGEYVTDSYELTTMVRDGYVIRVGLYDANTGLRLPIIDLSGTNGSDYVLLADRRC
jgi:4-amino-4-deoxy-L-arabinose transferase-like glycosyltransferase